VNPKDRRHFDDLLEQVLAELPEHIRRLLDEVPLIVEDYPSDEIMDELEIEYIDDLCGLHSGVPLTERSVEHSGTLPDRIEIYREGILSAATGRRGRVRERALKQQIRITLLHEIGHHFGLDEGDLRALGYG
jgi:predicted Zn-dependent protease with MMP-like domain